MNTSAIESTTSYTNLILLAKFLSLMCDCRNRLVLYCAAVAEGFDAQSIGLRLQKKLLGKMTSRRVVSAFIDDTTARLLNNLYRLGRNIHGGDKRTAEKAVRRLIKTVIKTGILYRNEQFSADELAIAEDFQKRFRIIAMTIISFHQVGGQKFI